MGPLENCRLPTVGKFTCCSLVAAERGVARSRENNVHMLSCGLNTTKDLRTKQGRQSVHAANMRA